MTHGSLFSGIGGFDLAAEWIGWENEFHCEWNEFGQKVLDYYFPNAESFKDITKTDFTKYANKIDVLTGGFPCQPYSMAGKRKGKEDSRHLWPEMLRAIREIQPRWVVGENVHGIINWNGGLVFNEVQTDLETAGYKVFPYVLPACSVGADHRRDRTWFIANSIIPRLQTGLPIGKNEGYPTHGKLYKTPVKLTSIEYSETKAFYRLTKDGVPIKLDGITFPKWRNESIKAAGNAIVPQVAYQIFKTIEKYETLITN